MDFILQVGASLIIWLQSLGSWLEGPMKFFSFLGTEQFYLMIAPAILWCFDASLGLRIGIFLMISASINNFFKLMLHGPRPFWIDSRLESLAAETSFGVPSGHSQNAVVVWGTPAARFGKRLVWIIALIIIFLISLSRLYLAVHYLHDVLIGWLIGGLVLWILSKYSQPIVTWLKQYKLWKQLIFAFVGSLLLILLNLIARWSLTNYSLPVEWVNTAAASFPDQPIQPIALAGMISNAGAFFGLAAGAIWLQHNGGFSTQGKPLQLALRYLIGLSGVVILWFGLGEVLPHGEAFGPFILRYLRYALVGFWVTGLVPFIFRKLGIAPGH